MGATRRWRVGTEAAIFDAEYPGKREAHVATSEETPQEAEIARPTGERPHVVQESAGTRHAETGHGRAPLPVKTLTQAELDRQVAEAEATTEGQSLSPSQASLRRLGRDRRAMFFTAVTLLIIVIAYVGPLIYTRIGPNIIGGINGVDTLGPQDYHNYAQVDINRTDGDPGFNIIHPLGTDQLGRDILARLMAGINISIEVAILVEVLDVGLGVTIGALAGYYGGWLATFLDRFTDIMFAFPGLLFAILVAGTLGPVAQSKLGLSGRLLLVSIALGISAWPFMARLVRGQTLQLREQQFIEASRAVGASNSSIILRHIVPNLFSIVLVAAVFDMVDTIGGEAVLSLLGLGVQPPGSSLGLMINDATQQALVNAWEVVWPTIALTLLILAFTFMGDGVQDAFNPRTVD
jgi:peptide/nickel transport system permease protein